MPQNGINHPGITALAQAFAVNPLLRIINLNDNTFTEKGGIAMAEVSLFQLPFDLLRGERESTFSRTELRSIRAFEFMHLLCSAQTLKKLRQVEVINFGDCLVRSKGAIAIAEAVKEGLHKLKVLAILFLDMLVL